MEWHEAIEAVSPYVVRISTPRCSGTGWLVSRSKTTDLCGIATAAHVIDQTHEWEEPIRLFHPATGQSVLLKAAERAVLLQRDMDTAAIICSGASLGLPVDTLHLIDREQHYKPGVDIGWLGFPAVAPTELCFFSGRVSAVVEGVKSYLVDGVAINGVSGGPAFACFGDQIDVFGVVSAYIPNRATGEVLPGVAVVRHISQFHDVADQFRSLDEAKDQEVPPTGASEDMSE